MKDENTGHRRSRVYRVLCRAASAGTGRRGGGVG